MFNGVWNRLTEFSLLCLVLAATGFVLVLFNSHLVLERYVLTICAITLTVGGMLIEAIGIRRSRLFPLSAAREIHLRTIQLIDQLWDLAPILHTNYDGLPDGRQKYESDKRYRDLVNEFNRVIAKCYDYTLYKGLSQLISNEKLSAKYLGVRDHKIGISAQNNDHINQYFGAKLNS